MRLVIADRPIGPPDSVPDALRSIQETLAYNSSAPSHCRWLGRRVTSRISGYGRPTHMLFGPVDSAHYLRYISIAYERFARGLSLTPSLPSTCTPNTLEQLTPSLPSTHTQPTLDSCLPIGLGVR
jgi:hypothetical protein